MSNTKLISLFGIDPQYDENSPTDFSQINTKSFSKKYHQLKAAQNFKPVWENSKEILEHIATLKSKKQLNQAKQIAMTILFKNKNDLSNEPTKSLKNSSAPSLKFKK